MVIILGTRFKCTNFTQNGGLRACYLHLVCICLPHLRVRIEKVTSTTALSQHLQQEVLSQQEKGDIELKTLTSQGHRGNVTYAVIFIFIAVSFSLSTDSFLLYWCVAPLTSVYCTPFI